MKNKRKKILFHYMLGIPSGGSDHSLYYHLVNLNKAHFEPIVVFNQESIHKEKLEKLGIKTLLIPLNCLKKTSTINLNKTANDTKLPQKRSFSKLRQIFTESKAFYKALPQAKIVWKLLNEYKIDIIHTNFNLSGSRPAIMASIFKHIPIIAHNRGLSELLNIDIFFSRFIYRIICISKYVSDEYVNAGVKEEKCVVIHNGVDTELFKPKKKLNNKFRIISIGRLEKWKGQHILIQAAKDVIKKYPDIEITLVGVGNEKAELEKLVKENNFENNVVFIRNSSNVSGLLQKSDLFVHTSIKPEPFGRVIIEAMAIGLPVIATAIGGPKEIIENNIDGFLVEPNEPLLLANKILDILKTDEDRNLIAINARKKVEDKFSIIKTTRLIEDLYHSVN